MSKKRLTDKELDNIIKTIEAYEKFQYPAYTYNNALHRDILKLNGIHTLNCFDKPDYDVLKKAVFDYKENTSLIDILDAINSFLADKEFAKKCKSMKCCNGDCREKCLNDEYTVDIFIDEDDIDDIEFVKEEYTDETEPDTQKDKPKKSIPKIKHPKDRNNPMDGDYLISIERNDGKLNGIKDTIYIYDSDFQFNPRLYLSNFKTIMDSKMNILIESNDINDVIMYINYLLNFYFRVRTPVSSKKSVLNSDGFEVFIKPILSTIINTVSKKYDDYGETNLIDSEKFGISPKNGILLRINDKINRIHNLLRPERVENYESVEDSFEDAIGYCFLIISLGVMDENSCDY